MSADFLCKLTAKVNELSDTVMRMQGNAGLTTDPSTESTLSGRIRALEESVISSDPTETNISRMQVDTVLEVVGGLIETTYAPIGDCVDRQVQVQSPDDPEVWETVGEVQFIDNIGDLGTVDYDGWKCTVSYIYASKIVLEEYSYTNAVNELVKDFYGYSGTVYKVIITVEPVGEVVLKWVDNNDSNDYVEESIVTTHVRYVNEEEFNNTMYLTGTATVKLEIRNRLG